MNECSLIRVLGLKIIENNPLWYDTRGLQKVNFLILFLIETKQRSELRWYTVWYEVVGIM